MASQRQPDPIDGDAPAGVLEAGCDWLTATLSADISHGADWLASGQDAVRLVAEDGNRLDRTGLLGYEGIMAAGQFAGTRPDGSLQRYTGAYASRLHARARHQDARASRLDLQVTVRLPGEVNAHILEQQAAALAGTDGMRGASRRLVRITSDNRGGMTLYVGSRSSDRMLRIYNKAAEAAEDERYAGCVRYEVEAKGKLAAELARLLWYGPLPQAALAVSYVRRYCNARGIVAPWVESDRDIAELPRMNVPTDDQRSLRWLEHQVRPTVARLRAAGYDEQVRTLLGLLAAPQDDTNERTV